MPPKVYLYGAKIPGIVGFVADHLWFVIEKDGIKSRWEIWQHKNVGSISWNHLHKDLLPPSAGVGNKEGWIIYRWEGEKAQDLISKIEQSPHNYPYSSHYRYWPGPNSNTYIQWILQEYYEDIILKSTAIGKDYLGFAGIVKAPSYFHFSTPLFGIKIKWPDHFEFHILTLTFGITCKPFSIVKPFSRGKKEAENSHF